MTYYEELGVPLDASVREIHQAYRVLARLLHPDGQASEPVRSMAERQMKRLNDMLATLTDPQRRREYDDSLLAPAAPLMAAGGAAKAAVHRPSTVPFRPRPEPWRTSLPAWAGAALANWFWVVLAAVILSVACWYVSAGSSTPAAEATLQPLTLRERQPAARPAPYPATPSALPAPRQAPAPVATVERPAPEAVPPPETASRQAASRPLPVLAPAPQVAALPLPVKPETLSALAVARSAAPSFAGNWLYVPTSGDASARGTYPATYVELLLTQERGGLSGRYRARYTIPDRAVSPEVSFRVEGKSPAGDLAKLAWTSADGARGELDMTLEGPNAMSVTWWTTELGRHASLASGTAKLLRQLAP